MLKFWKEEQDDYVKEFCQELEKKLLRLNRDGDEVLVSELLTNFVQTLDLKSESIDEIMFESVHLISHRFEFRNP